MALSRHTWLAGARYLCRSGLLLNHGPNILRRTVLPIKPQIHPGFRNLFYKSPGSTMDALRIWKLLEYSGMDYCRIVRMRRRMKRFSYPWLTYCIPAAMILAVGDFIAQYHLKPHASDRTFKKFLTEEWIVGETLIFALIGFFPVGFVLSKWNLNLYRKLKCHGKLSFLLTKLLLDLLILSPILLALMALAYGAAFDRNTFKKSTEEIKETFKRKYWPAIKESMMFNITTRPVGLFGIFYLAPIHLRRLFKTVYEVIFATYVTDSIRKNVQGSGAGSSKNVSTAGGSTSDLKGHPFGIEGKPLSRWARYKRWACRNRGD